MNIAWQLYFLMLATVQYTCIETAAEADMHRSAVPVRHFEKRSGVSL